MQRLICAEEMEERIHAVYGLREPTKENMLAALERCHTIDAIPMWWITEKFLDVLNKDKALSAAVWLVKKAWQQEQEAER